MKYKRKNINFFKIYDKYIVPLEKNSIVLEIWPGNWNFSYYLYKKFNLSENNIYLLDISITVIEKLKSQNETKNFNIILSDSIEYLKKTNKKFDLIIMRHVLEHMKKDYINKLIPYLINSLSDNWKILIEVPNLWNYPLGIYMFFWDYSHETWFTEKSIKECFLRNSTKEIEILTTNIFYPIEFTFNPLRLLKNILVRLIEFISIISTFLYRRIRGQWVRTPRLLCIIKIKTKKSK